MDTLYLYFIGLSVAVGLLSVRRDTPLPLKLFLLFLGYTLANELVVLSIKGSNHWLYNIYNYFRFTLLGIIYLQLLVTPVIKKIIFWFLLSLPLWLGLSFYFTGGFYQLHTPSVLAGSVMVVFVTVSYLFELLQFPGQGTLFSRPFFWISTGLMFYFLGNLPYLGSINYLVKKDMNLAIRLYYIIYALNAIMYTLFVVAFISTWNRKKFST